MAYLVGLFISTCFCHTDTTHNVFLRRAIPNFFSDMKCRVPVARFVWLFVLLVSANLGRADKRMPGLPYPLGHQFWFAEQCNNSAALSTNYRVFNAKKRPPGWKSADSITSGKALIKSWTELLQRNRVCTLPREDCCKTGVTYTKMPIPKSKRSCQNLPRFSESSNSTCVGVSDLHKYSWGTCAYVAQGSNLLRRKQGNEIDRHSTVIRFGHMPLSGWEAFTGKRTDVLIGRGGIQAKHAGDYHALKHVIGRDVTVISKQAGVQMLQFSNILYVRPQPRVLGDTKVLLRDPDVMNHLYCAMSSKVGKKARGRSSGIAALLYIISSKLCEHIDVYGMSADCGGYYHLRKYAMKLHHSCELESWFLHELMKSYYSLARTCVWN